MEGMKTAAKTKEAEFNDEKQRLHDKIKSMLIRQQQTQEDQLAELVQQKQRVEATLAELKLNNMVSLNNTQYIHNTHTQSIHTQYTHT